MKIPMLLVLAIGCAYEIKPSEIKDLGPSFTVKVDSISAPKASGKTFSIVSGDKSIPNNDLRFREYAKQASNALKLDGFTPSSKPAIKILLTYGIGNPVSYTETTSVPVYGKTTSQVSNNWGQNVGSVQTWGQQGFNTESTNHTKYKRTIVLKAVSTKSGEPVWETVITSTGRSSDLGRVAPFMLFGGTKHFGTSTKGKYDIYESDVRALALKQ